MLVLRKPRVYRRRPGYWAVRLPLPPLGGSLYYARTGEEALEIALELVRIQRLQAQALEGSAWADRWPFYTGIRENAWPGMKKNLRNART